MRTSELRDDGDARVQRMRLSLDGLSVGNRSASASPEWIVPRKLPADPWRFTDDRLLRRVPLPPFEAAS